MRLLKPLVVSTIALLLVVCCALPGVCKVIYVNAARPDDTGGGLSWGTAKQKVQSGVSVALSGDEVWVAQGTYVECISLNPGVSLYGGFAGMETQRSQRDSRLNITVLDGGGIGSVIAVVAYSYQDKSFTIDGFTIRNGNSTTGGGIYCYKCPITVQNNLITENVGSGILMEMGAYIVTISGNTISSNSRSSGGGGICCGNNSGILRITDNVIESNSAGEGGGLYCNVREATISGNVIRGNTATGRHQDLDKGGGLCAWNCRHVYSNYIAGNYAPSGGGVYWGSGPGSLYNNTIVSNCASKGGGIYNENSATQAVAISNNIVAFNSSGITAAGSTLPILRNNCLYNPYVTDYSGVSPGTGDIRADPGLVAVGFGQLHIQPESPCIDAGDDTAVQSGQTDADGQPRVQGSHVDIGADESDGTRWPYQASVYRVSPSGDDSNDGSSWQLAKRTIQAAIDSAAGQGGEIWVTAGTYQESLRLKAHTYLYGGFARNEVVRDQRNWSANATIMHAPTSAYLVVGELMGHALSCVNGFRFVGAGISCEGSSPMITNNTITGVPPGLSGLAIRADGGHPVIVGNVLSGNAGSIRCASATILNNVIRGCGPISSFSSYADLCIANNLIVGNYGSEGSAVYLWDVKSASIVGNTIVANGATNGASIHCATPGQVTISNNIIAFNSGGIYKQSGKADPILRNNCVYNPDGYNYSGLSAGTGDISVDPLFTAVEYGQLHLRSDSPCIDAGDDASALESWPDIDVQSRVQGSHVDIGADESDGSTWTHSPTTVRVSPSGDDANDGSSWALAKKSVQAALDAASVLGGEVWVAQGTYSARLMMRPFAYLYGAFDGTEDNRNARRGSREMTVISVPSHTTDTPSNVLFRGGGRYSSIDGFTISDGWGQNGGGIYCANCNPTISNCVLTNNTAGEDGGAMYCTGSFVTIQDSLISRSKVTNINISNGAAVVCAGGSAVITGCTFEGNSAGALRCSGAASVTFTDNIVTANGYGVSSAASSTIQRCTIAGNGGVGVGVGGNATIANCTISANLGTGVVCSGAFRVIDNVISGNCGADMGGGIVCAGALEGAIVANNTIFGNIGTEGGGVYVNNCSPTFVNNIVAFNSSGFYGKGAALPVLRNNCVYNPDGYDYAVVSPGSNDLCMDPGLASARFGRLHIQPDSPCLDVGDDSFVQADRVDIDGQQRVQGAHVDIGADESDGTLWDSSSLTMRVSPDGSDANDGSSWLLAKESIQAGIDAAATAGGQVWVAAGTYREQISMKPHVQIYGGFIGSESAWTERDWRTNTSAIEGSGGSSIVSTIGAGMMSILDGFVLQKGSTAVDCRQSSPTLTHNTIRDNTRGISCIGVAAKILENTITQNGGSGISVSTKSRALIYRNTITSNSASQGGGISCTASACPLILDNYICNNRASQGGAVYCYQASANIRGNRITGNSADYNGGAVYSDQSQPVLTSNMILANSTPGAGGGVYCAGNSTNNPTLCNNTIAGNTAGEGGGVYSYYGAPVIANNIVVYNSSGIFRSGTGTPVVSNNCVFNPGGYDYSGLSAGTGDIAADPMFVDLAFGQAHIQPTSPCRDAGNDSFVQQNEEDIDSQPRIQDGRVDIGADESDGTEWRFIPVTVKVAPTGSDQNDGSSWSLAKRTVQAGIDAASAVGGEVWVAAGKYTEGIALHPFVYLYGGFSGGETVRAQRSAPSYRTILDGSNSATVVSVRAGRQCSAIDGFTIQNGSANNSSYSGGGVFCQAASPSISNNIIKNNRASSYGAGIFCSSSGASVVGNLVTNNTNGSGGGIYCAGGSVIITHNTICANAGGISCYQSPSKISNNIVAYSAYGSGVTSTTQQPPILQNNCVYNPGRSNYSGLTAGIGDIQVDPLFIDRTAGNYHIQQTSPCIDQGWNDAAAVPSVDMDIQARVNGSATDIGADEYWVIPTVSGVKSVPDGVPVTPGGAIVAAAFPDFFYLEALDRTSGIRVDRSAHGLTVGARADVSGTAQTNADGERYIAASAVSKIGSGSVGPLALNNSWLGGGAFGYQGGVWGWQTVLGADGKAERVWGPASGLNTIGLLVTTCGRVVPERTAAGSITIDDGSSVFIKCILPGGVAVDPSWSYVSVTGACSCEKVLVDGREELHAVVRVRAAGDILPW